jgi:protocatechuate 3,4-dioxygenase, alpha subunit
MLRQTPSQTVGPFFHHGMPSGSENTLVTDLTHGKRIRISGIVFDGESRPIPDAVLEIWQADAHGYFNHPIDPHCGEADKHFKGFGRCATVNSGHYEFYTIKPGGIPDQAGQIQAPFINLRIFMRGLLIHAYTRLYFSDERANETDPLLNAIDSGRRGTLIAKREDHGDQPTYHFDIHMQGEQETVFFEP